jgi:hypothetical protein
MRNAYIVIRHVQEFFELNSTIRKRAECPLLLEVGGDLGIGDFSLSLPINKER